MRAIPKHIAVLVLLCLYFVTHKFFALARPFESSAFQSIITWLFYFLANLALVGVGVALVFGFFLKIFKMPAGFAAICTTILAAIILLEPDLDFSKFESPLLRKRYVGLVLVVVVSLVIWKSYRSTFVQNILYNYLNALLTLLLVYNLVLIAINFEEESSVHANIEKPTGFEISCENCRDIYYIILDGYASNASLQKYWQYDNKAFTDTLERLGFFVSYKSKTQFRQTYQSMTSSLNMSADSLRILKMHRYALLSMIENNTVVNYLSNAGYESINLSFFRVGKGERFYEFSNVNEERDKNILTRLVNNTIIKSFTNVLSDSRQYDINLSVLEKTIEVSKQRTAKPRFIYAHVLSPHQPFVMDSLAQKISTITAPRNIDEWAYLNQLKGLNKLVTKSIASILDNYPERGKPIIVLQSDHGFRFLPGSPDDEAKSILNAYYFPGNIETLHDGISPYNTFRIIFNKYFEINGRNLPILSDQGAK